MARKVQIESATDFTGGLNLAVQDFQLAPNESPDLLNVDLDRRGGFVLRNVVNVMNETDTGTTPQNIWQYEAGSTKQVIIQQGNDIAYSTGDEFTADTLDAVATTGKMRAITFNDLNYVQRNAEQVPFKWNGSAETILSDPAVAGYSEDFDSPSTNRMPKAKCIAVWRGYVWVANLVEDATARKNRVRWSHPNNPEAWRTADNIDLDIGHDGDEITALVPMVDRLLVFKSKSTHIITGSGAEDFRAVPIAQHTGAISQEATCVQDQTCYAFSWNDGLYAVQPNNEVVWKWGKVFPTTSGHDTDRTDEADPEHRAEIVIGSVNRKIWVSLPRADTGATHNDVTYVLDPELGRPDRRKAPEGAWTKYDFGCGPMITWRPTDAASVPLACHPNDGFVLMLDQEGTQDNFGLGVVNIASHFQTRWFDAGSPSLKKRWRRTDIIIHNEIDAAINVKVFRDYDPTVPRKEFTIFTDPPSTGGLWGENWGEMIWDTGEGHPHFIRRAPSLSSGRAVSLVFEGPTPSVHWGVNAVNMKYILRTLR